MPHLCFLAALALSLQDPPTPQAPENLLANASAEAGGKAPEAWRKGEPVPGVAYVWAEDVAAEGRRSLGLAKSVERYFPIAQWTQEVAYDGRASRLHFGSLVKAAGVTKALLDVQFEDAAGHTSHRWAAYVGARQAGDPPVDHDWTWYSGVVAIPSGTKVLRVGLQVYGPGRVWFDRMLATFVADDVAETDAVALTGRPAEAWGTLPQAEAAAPRRDAERGPERRTLEGEAGGSYFLFAPRGPAPKSGHGVLVVLPGGDGSADFAPFVGRIAEQALPPGYLVVQPIAPAHERAKEIVWPKRSDRIRSVPAIEDFVERVLGEVQREHEVDKERVFLLGWSSGGPACYAIATDRRAPVRGALVAMSVFHPPGSLAGAKGRAFYVLHSPQDFIAMRFPEAAVRDLARAGAATKLQTYEGGHGWHGDTFGMIRTGVEWLEEQSARRR